MRATAGRREVRGGKLLFESPICSPVFFFSAVPWLNETCAPNSSHPGRGEMRGGMEMEGLTNGDWQEMEGGSEGSGRDEGWTVGQIDLERVAGAGTGQNHHLYYWLQTIHLLS